MKKLLTIVVLGLLWCNVAFAYSLPSLDYLSDIGIVIVISLGIFLVLATFFYFSLNPNPPKNKEGFKLIFSIIHHLISAAVLIGILFFIYVGIMEFKEYLDERADRKAICAERIESVENDVAAKKLFEACMDR